MQKNRENQKVVDKDINDMDIFEIMDISREVDLHEVNCVGYARISDSSDVSNTLINQGKTICETAIREKNNMLSWKDALPYIKSQKIKQAITDEQIDINSALIFPDKKSGSTFNRVYFQEMYHVVEEWNKSHSMKEKIRVLYLRDYDRLGRVEESESLEIIKYFENGLNCKIWSCTESRDELARYISIGIAKQYRKKTARKIREGQVREFSKGKYFTQPSLGYIKKNIYDTSTGKLMKQELIQVPIEIDFVKRMYQEYQKNKSYYAIQKKFEHEGLEILKQKFQREDRKCRVSFSYKFVKHVLTNTLYCGFASMNMKNKYKIIKTLYKQIDIEPVIDVKTFFELNPKTKIKMEGMVFNNKS